MKSTDLNADQSTRTKSFPVQNSLVIGKKEKSPLNKNQLAFNRYIKRIESLQKELVRNEKVLEENLAFYGRQIHPKEQEMLLILTSRLKHLFVLYEENQGISKADRAALKQLIKFQLYKIIEINDNTIDTELDEVFKGIEGMSFQKAKEEEFKLMKENMAQAFEKFGVDVDHTEFSSASTEEEIHKIVDKLHEKLGFHNENMEDEDDHPPNRKKTKKQLEKQDRAAKLEEARKKNISSIYRQLAKLLHPDLEQDSGMKLEKETMMQELTEAYKKNDLHTLLRLELKWVQKEENNPEKLTKEKLNIYNQVLKEQVQDLESELSDLNDNPRFRSLQKFSRFEPLHQINFKMIEKEMREKIISLQTSLEDLKGKKASTEIRKLVNVFKREGEIF